MKIFLTLILNFIGFNIAHVNLNQSKYNVVSSISFKRMGLDIVQDHTW